MARGPENGARGKADGNDVTYDNTHVEAGNTLALQSGGDTTLQGAVAKAEQIQAEVGGKLKVESLQDTSHFESKQQSIGASVTIGAGASGSFSASSSKTNSDYANVAEQSGLKAGDGGFQVNVKGDTELKGGAITSTEKALQDNKNAFTTGGRLTTSDIQNSANYSANSIGATLGTSQLNDGTFKPAGNSAGIGSDQGSASSTTQAGITGIAGNTAARTGDAESGIQPLFDAGKVQQDIDAQVLIARTFGAQASKAVGDYAKTQIDAARQLKADAAKESDPNRKTQLEQQAQQLENDWGDNGTQRILAHTVIGGLTGGAPGAAGTAVGTLTAPVVADALKAAGIDGPLATALTAIASTASGAAVGGTAGAAGSFNEVANNYLSHPENQARLKEARACANGDKQACDRRDAWDEVDKKRDEKLREACFANGASAECSARYAHMTEARSSYSGKAADPLTREDRAAGLDKYTAASERESFKPVLNVPHYDAQAIAKAGEAIKVIGNLALDLTPIVGDAKAFSEANTKLDYALATLGALGPTGDVAKALVKEAKALLEVGDVAKAADKLSEAEKTMTASIGSKNNWDKAIKGQLEPAAIYKLDNGHRYMTDASGRVSSVEGKLSLTTMDRNKYQQCAAGKCGDIGDEGGHLIASSLGGAGDRINIVPQASTLNRGDWKNMENELRNALRDGESVSVKIDVGYPVGGGGRPNEFTVFANIGGKLKEFTFRQ